MEALALEQGCEGNLSCSKPYSLGSTDSRTGPYSGFATYIYLHDFEQVT